MKYQLIIKVRIDKRVIGELEIDHSKDLDALFVKAAEFNQQVKLLCNTELCVRYEFVMFCTNFFNSSTLHYDAIVRG